MQRAFSVLIVGILVLLGTSFTQAYNHVPELSHLKTDQTENAVLEQIYFNPVDYPQQEGNLRIFKEVTQKHRTSEDDVISCLGFTSSLCELSQFEQTQCTYVRKPQSVIIHADGFLFIRNRAILI